MDDLKFVTTPGQETDFSNLQENGKKVKAEMGKSDRMGTRQTKKAAFESDRKRILKGFNRIKGSSEHQGNLRAVPLVFYLNLLYDTIGMKA